MEILPYQDLPIAQEQPTKDEDEILQEIQDWSEGRTAFYSIAFQAVDGDPQEFSSYSLRLGIVSDGHLVTTPGRIIEISKMLPGIPEDCRDSLRRVLNFYFERINRVPVWGKAEYQTLVDSGKTPRILEGPSKSGELRVGESRWIVYDKNKNIVYGPVIRQVNKS